MTAPSPYDLRWLTNTAVPALMETAWPTRCVLCDKPGSLLCEPCWLSLPFIDQSMACPACGAPFGQVQCTECNSTMLAASGLERLPFESCRSVFSLDDRVRKMVTTYKDRDERRLATTMARMMMKLLDPAWVNAIEAVTYIPDTSSAVARRGFDHSRLLAQDTARLVGKPCLGLLRRPKATDQRTLGRKARLANMKDAFQINPAAQGRIPQNILLIDDVITTGATLYAATSKLASSGAQEVHCVTFARAW